MTVHARFKLLIGGGGGGIRNRICFRVTMHLRNAVNLSATLKNGRILILIFHQFKKKLTVRELKV